MIHILSGMGIYSQLFWCCLHNSSVHNKSATATCHFSLQFRYSVLSAGGTEMKLL